MLLKGLAGHLELSAPHVLFGLRLLHLLYDILDLFQGKVPHLQLPSGSCHISVVLFAHHFSRSVDVRFGVRGTSSRG